MSTLISTLPSLSIDGYITNRHVIMYKLWLYFLASEYSQSNIWRKQIYSLKYILNTIDDKMDIGREIELALTKLYENYFDNVQAVCVTNVINVSKIHITISLVCEYDKNTYTLKQELSSTNNHIDDYEEKLDELYKFFS